MYGRYSVTDLMGQCYWRTDDMLDAFHTSRQVAAEGVELLVIRDETNGRTVYMQHGRVSVYVQNGRDIDRPRRVA